MNGPTTFTWNFLTRDMEFSEQPSRCEDSDIPVLLPPYHSRRTKSRLDSVDSGTGMAGVDAARSGDRASNKKGVGGAGCKIRKASTRRTKQR